MKNGILGLMVIFSVTTAQAGKWSECVYKKELRGSFNDIKLSIMTPIDLTSKDEGFYVSANLTVGSYLSGGGVCEGLGGNKIKCGFECDSGEIHISLEDVGIIGLEAKTAELSNGFVMGCSSEKAADFIGTQKIILDRPVCNIVERED